MCSLNVELMTQFSELSSDILLLETFFLYDWYSNKYYCQRFPLESCWVRLRSVFNWSNFKEVDSTAEIPVAG